MTEMVTGLDLVAEQIAIAAGEPLSFGDAPPAPRGWSMEARDHRRGSARAASCPSVGRIERLRLPQGPGVRNDAGVYRGYEVPVFYDSLLAKLVVWGADRERARRRMRRALDEYVLEGVAPQPRVPSLAGRAPGVRRPAISRTRFLEEHFTPAALEPDRETRRTSRCSRPRSTRARSSSA